MALGIVPSREELLGSRCHSSKMSRKPSLTQSSTKAQRSTYFSHLSGTCAGCTSTLTQSPCLPAERGARTEQDVSIHTAHPTCRKSSFLQHNPTFRAQGPQQSGVLFASFPDWNPYPKGDFYPVFHALLQHKCLLLVAFQITYRDRRGLLRAPLCCVVLWDEFPWPEAAGAGAAGAGNGPKAAGPSYAARARQAMPCDRTLQHSHCN